MNKAKVKKGEMIKWLQQWFVDKDNVDYPKRKSEILKRFVAAVVVFDDGSKQDCGIAWYTASNCADVDIQAKISEYNSRKASDKEGLDDLDKKNTNTDGFIKEHVLSIQKRYFSIPILNIMCNLKLCREDA